MRRDRWRWEEFRPSRPVVRVKFALVNRVPVSVGSVVQRAVRVAERVRCRMRAETNRRRTFIDEARAVRVGTQSKLLNAAIKLSTGFGTKDVVAKPPTRVVGISNKTANATNDEKPLKAGKTKGEGGEGA